MRVTLANRKHSQSPRDFIEFSRCHYEAPHATTIVHPSWKYQRGMWPRIEAQQADQYLTSMTTSPLITIKVNLHSQAKCRPEIRIVFFSIFNSLTYFFCCRFQRSTRPGSKGGNQEVLPKLLDLHESISEAGSEHDTIYVGGAVWAMKWVPLPSSDSCRSPSAADGKASKEEYLLTVSHSKGSQPELMQMNKAGVVLADGQMSRGSLSLWAVQLNSEKSTSKESTNNDDNTHTEGESN